MHAIKDISRTHPEMDLTKSEKATKSLDSSIGTPDPKLNGTTSLLTLKQKIQKFLQLMWLMFVRLEDSL